MGITSLTKSAALVMTAGLFAASANAGIISGALHVDNAHQTYLSTDNSVQGDLLVTGANWPAAQTFSFDMADGQDYFLHISAQDHGGIAGLLGSFTIAGDSHVFANGSNSIDTNTQDWLVSLTGWENYTGATFLGDNGAGPWGYRSTVNSTADWIWSSDAHNHNQVYFSLAITATSQPEITPPETTPVSEPASLALLGMGLLGLGGLRGRRKRSAS